VGRLTIYGALPSRAARTLWMARELGLDFAHEPVGGEALQSAAFRKINPNGRVPAIRDGDLTLFESLAINLYLARKHGGPLQPATLEDEARALQWSFWAATEVERPAVTLLLEGRKPEAERNAGAVEAARKELQRPLSVLEQHLADRSCLLGPAFTVADLNVAAVVGALPRAGFDLTPWPKLQAWLERCTTRPAAQAR
jgi:glutathione S-transferase